MGKSKSLVVMVLLILSLVTTYSFVSFGVSTKIVETTDYQVNSGKMIEGPSRIFPGAISEFSDVLGHQGMSWRLEKGVLSVVGQVMFLALTIMSLGAKW